MRVFRVRLTDGRVREIAADRVVADASGTVFQVRIQGRWQAVLELPTAAVAHVARRVTEIDGRWTWVRTDPARASSVRPVEQAGPTVEAGRGR